MEREQILAKMQTSKFKIPKVVQKKEVEPSSPLLAEGIQKQADEEMKKRVKQREEQENRARARVAAAERRRKEAEKGRKIVQERELRVLACDLFELEIDNTDLVREIDSWVDNSEPNPNLQAQSVQTSEQPNPNKRKRCFHCGGRGHIPPCNNPSKKELKRLSKQLGVDLHIKTPKKKTLAKMQATTAQLGDLIPVPTSLIPPPVSDPVLPSSTTNFDVNAARPCWVEMCGLPNLNSIEKTLLGE